MYNMKLVGRRLTCLIRLYLRFKYIGYSISYKHKKTATEQVFYKSRFFPRTVAVELYDNRIQKMIVSGAYQTQKQIISE